jgi:hypothetical protein
MHQNQKWLQFGYNLQKNGLLNKEGLKCNQLILLVPRAGVEPARSNRPRDFKSLASTNSATQAFLGY